MSLFTKKIAQIKRDFKKTETKKSVKPKKVLVKPVVNLTEKSIKSKIKK